MNRFNRSLVSCHITTGGSTPLSGKSSPNKENPLGCQKHPLVPSQASSRALHLREANQQLCDRAFHKIRINLTQPETAETDNTSGREQPRGKVHQKREQLVYQALNRNFEEALDLISAPMELSIENIVQLLNKMGFLQQPIINEEDLRLVSGAFHMLGGRSDRGVTRPNLLLFLLTISNIEPPHWGVDAGNLSPSKGLHRDEEAAYQAVPIEIGSLDGDGAWRLSHLEHLLVRKTFRKLLCNRISNRQPSSRSHQRGEQEARRPQTQLRASSGSEDRRPGLQRCKPSLQALQEQRLARELKECTFQPRINRPRLKQESGSSSLDRCKLLFELSKKRQNLERATSTQRMQLMQLQQCTFHPSLTALNADCLAPVHVRNSQKAAHRMATGRRDRQISAVAKERGYPHQIANWSKFIYQAHKPRKELPKKEGVHSREKQRKPIACLDIGSALLLRQLEVYDGDSVESLGCKLLVRNRLQYDRLEELMQLIRLQLGEDTSLLVREGFVYRRQGK